MNGTYEDKDNNFGERSPSSVIKLANINNKFNNKSEKEILPLPLLTTLSAQGSPSKSKVFKRHAIHLIRFSLKSGITRNTEIKQFLKENKVVLKARTFDRYKSIAERELQNDLDADIWLSEKTQNALVHDYKDISDRYDRQLVLDDMLMDDLIKKAVDAAVQHGQDPDKYYIHLDFNEIVKIQAISNFTMKNKLELISKGFIIYKIKQHIEHLHDQQRQNDSNRKNKEIDLKLEVFQKSSNSTQLAKLNHNSNNQEQEQEYDQEYLDRNDLAIGMNGQPIKKYLAEIEKRLGHALSSI